MASDPLRNALKEYADYDIYRRGDTYAKSGNVGVITTTDGDGITSLQAEVFGSRTYDTELSFHSTDSVHAEIDSFLCSCPFVDSMCKHVVALGLTYCSQYEKKSPAILVSPNGIRKVDARDATPVAIAKKQKRFNEQYDLHISIGSNTIRDTHVERRHDRHYWYQTFRETGKSLLATESNLSEKEKKLLLLIETHEKSHARYSKKDSTDYTCILAAARDADVQIVYGGSYGKPKVLTWRAADKLAVELRLEMRESYDMNYRPTTFKYACITCTVPRFAKDPVQGCATGEAGLIIMLRDTIEIHTISQPLARTIAAALGATREDFEMRPYQFQKTKRRPSAPLADADYIHLNDILSDARRNCTLTTTIHEAFTNITHTPKPVILIDFRTDEHLLDILPAIDYGTVTLPVSSTNYRSTSKGKQIVRRRDPAFGTTHVVRIEGTTVHIAPVDLQHEHALIVHGEKHGIELGLTKKGRALLKGEKQVTRYLLDYFPALKAYAEKHGYEITYSHDIPDITAADFRADFDADMNAENNWLAFDLALYCGSERVTLADIEAFALRGDSLFKTKDGRILKITNPETIERLLELLAHFRKNGERFEGHAFHAPALDAMAKSSPHYTARHSKDMQTFLGEAARGKAVNAVRIPAPFDKALRGYQRDGVHWANFLRRYRFGGVLADDMGLGKTIQALAVISMNTGPDTAPSIVIAPKTLLHNWAHEAATFAPHLKTLVIDGTVTERRALIKKIPDYHLIITSYPALQKDIDLYEKRKKPFHYCILDEAQSIKNPRTRNAHTVKRLSSDYRLALTGTPLENSVEELWSLFDFLMPGFLGHHAHFQKHFGSPIMKHSDARALEHLRSRTQTFMLRRTKEKVLTELPPKIEQTVECTLSDEQNILYQDVLQRVRSDIFNEVKKNGFAGSQIHIFAGLTRLRQICNHPALVLPAKKGTNYPSAKLDALMNIVEEIRAEKRKVLVFSQFTSMLDIIATELSVRKIGYEYLSGKTRDRKGVVDAFNSGNAPVFLLSTKAGGVGLNLVVADTVVIFDPWWNPQVERQAADRAHRIGQTKSVNVYRLRTKGTIEEKIAALQERKSKLFDALVDDSKDLFKKLTWDDVRGLLGESI